MRLAPQHRIYAVFFLFAISMGALLSRLPDLQEKLGVTESQLGLTLIGMSIGSLISLTLSAPLIARLGARTTAFVTVFGTTAIYAIIPWLPAAPAVFAALFLAGLLAGALEINVNIETDRIEAQLGKRIMNRAHGFWSLGFFVTALIGAGVRQAEISMQVHVGTVFVLVLVFGLVFISGITNAPERADAHPDAAHRFSFPTLGLLPLCLIAVAALLVEGAGIDWSAIYMRDIWHVAPFIGGMGLTLFAGCMAAVRLSIDPIVDRFGPRAVVTALLAICAGGVLLVGFAPNPYLALIGFALMGAGSSGVYPLAVSAAAQRTDRPAAVNVAALGQISFVVFFLGPPLLGFVAQYLGIRNSYLIVLPILLAGLLVVRALATRQTTTRGPHLPEEAPTSIHG